MKRWISGFGIGVLMVALAIPAYARGRAWGGSVCGNYQRGYAAQGQWRGDSYRSFGPRGRQNTPGGERFTMPGTTVPYGESGPAAGFGGMVGGHGHGSQWR